MKKPFVFAFALTLGLTIASCGDQKKATAQPTTEANTNSEVETVLKDYEAFADKYEELAQKKDAGEDVFDALMQLTEEGFDVSEKLIQLEGKLTDEQQLRMEKCAMRIDSIKEHISEL